jgi:hypothetical protein
VAFEAYTLLAWPPLNAKAFPDNSVAASKAAIATMSLFISASLLEHKRAAKGCWPYGKALE